MNPERSAALLVRVWLEDDSSAFRARMTGIGRPDGDEPVKDLTVAVAASPDDVLTAVTAWLDRFLSGPEASDHRP